MRTDLLLCCGRKLVGIQLAVNCIFFCTCNRSLQVGPVVYSRLPRLSHLHWVNVDRSVWENKTNQSKFIKNHWNQVFLYLQLFTFILKTWKTLLGGNIHKRYYYFVFKSEISGHAVLRRHQCVEGCSLTTGSSSKAWLSLNIHKMVVQ